MQRLGKYELRGEIGRGAMGTVYTAWDPVLDRRIAIKTARLSDQPDRETEESVARFRQEARLAGQLTHPGIVGIYDYGEADGLAYIVMEFVEGETLKAVLDRREPIGLDRTLDIMQQMLLALGHCHRSGIVHRDLKPSNLLVRQDGRVKLTDFGVARTGTSDLTMDGSLIGTPAYMSPEQFTAKHPADQRTDIYAGGVICYELLTGKRPFEGDMAMIMHQVLSDQPVPPSQRFPAVSAALDAAVLRALAKHPEDRFPSADAFAAALQAVALPDATTAFADVTLVEAAPASSTQPVVVASAGGAGAAAAAVAARRGRPWLALGGGLAVVGVLAAGFLWWFLAGPISQPRPGATQTAALPTPAARPASPPAPAPRPASPPSVASPPAPVAATRPAVSAPTPAPAPAPAPALAPALAPAPQLSPPAAAPALQPADLAATFSVLGCANIAWQLQSSTPRLVLSGLVGSGAPRAALDFAVAQFTGDGVRNEVKTFPNSASFCLATDIARSAASATPNGGVRLTLQGDGRRLVQGQEIKLGLQMAEFDGEMRIDYITDGGATTLHAVPLSGAPPHYRANAEIKVGARGDGVIGTVGRPYGVDMILAIASSLPLFTASRPTQEGSTRYLDQLQTAIESVRQQGGQVSVSAIVVETAER